MTGTSAHTGEALVGFQGLRLTSASETRNACIRLLKNKGFKEDAGESMEMLGIIGKLRENGLHHARTAQTRRSPAMRVQPAMEVEERPDAASSPGSPCSPLSSRCSGRSAGSPTPPSTPSWRNWNRRLRAPVCRWRTPCPCWRLGGVHDRVGAAGGGKGRLIYLYSQGVIGRVACTLAAIAPWNPYCALLFAWFFWFVHVWSGHCPRWIVFTRQRT